MVNESEREMRNVADSAEVELLPFDAGQSKDYPSELDREQSSESTSTR
jgi:hypothetical protein